MFGEGYYRVGPVDAEYSCLGHDLLCYKDGGSGFVRSTVWLSRLYSWYHISRFDLLVSWRCSVCRIALELHLVSLLYGFWLYVVFYSLLGETWWWFQIRWPLCRSYCIERHVLLLLEFKDYFLLRFLRLLSLVVQMVMLLFRWSWCENGFNPLLLLEVCNGFMLSKDRLDLRRQCICGRMFGFLVIYRSFSTLFRLFGLWVWKSHLEDGSINNAFWICCWLKQGDADYHSSQGICSLIVCPC